MLEHYSQLSRKQPPLGARKSGRLPEVVMYGKNQDAISSN